MFGCEEVRKEVWKLHPHILTSLLSYFQKRLRVHPLPQLALEMPALVHEDLPVLGQHDARPLERSRRRAFEIDAGDAEAAAVTGALEFVLRRQIVRRAAQVRAGHAQRIEAAGVLLDVLGRPYEPDAVFFLPPFVDADAVLVGDP